MENRSAELKVGLVVLITLVALVWGITWIKGWNLSQNTYEVKVLFPNVGILNVGDPVTVSGVEKGKVKKIELSAGEVLVTFSLASDVQLKEDAKFSIMNVGLMGERLVNVNTGSGEKPLDLAQSHKGSFDPGIPEVMAMTGELVTEVRDLVTSLREAVGTEQGKSSLQKSIKNMENVSVRLSKFFDKNTGKMDQAVEEFVYSTAQLKDFMQNNKQKLENTIDKWNQLTSTLEDVSQSMKKLSDKINNGEGSLGQLVNDTTLYADLKRTIKNADDLITDIKKNPKKYLKLEIF